MRIISLLILVLLFGCNNSQVRPKASTIIKNNKKRTRIRNRKISKAKSRSDDCDYFERKFKKPIIIDDLKYLYPRGPVFFNDWIQMYLIGYTSCLDGEGREGIIDLMGLPSENTDLLMSYVFFEPTDKGKYKIENELVFMFHPNILGVDSLISIGLMSGIVINRS